MKKIILAALPCLCCIVPALAEYHLGGKSRDFNAGMAEKMPHDCIGLG